MTRSHCFNRLAGGHSFTLALTIAVCLTSCATQKMPASPDGIPSLVVGEFVDDYGIRYTIDGQVWLQQPHARYEVVAWYPDEQFVIARNGPENPSEPGLYTRIDWIVLEGHAPYEWAFCYTAYDATSAEDALNADQVDRTTPRTGCNGYPFSRMRPATNED